MKLRLIILLAKFAGLMSRIFGRGSGVMVAGRIILKLDRDAVTKLSKNRRIILISGTNGKTTTTSLIRHAIETTSEVVCNVTGANLFAGVADALSENLRAPIGVLEVDEMVIPWAVKETKPEILVFLNLGRDQLDRLSEVRVVAQKWKAAVAQLPPSAKVLADADDPFVVWAAQDCPNVVWFSAGALGHLDASTCPECGEVLAWSHDASVFACPCGFKKPKPEWTLVGSLLKGRNSNEIEIRSAIPGAAALSNAARSVVVATMVGVDPKVAAQAIAGVASVDGRFGKLKIAKTNFRLMLSKNPASWRETLKTSESGPNNVLLVVNAMTQDGKDTSWLWDVDFAPLAGRNVLVTGERRLDVSARLTVGGINHQIVKDETEAAERFGVADADLIASYTAFHRLAKAAKQR